MLISLTRITQSPQRGAMQSCVLLIHDDVIKWKHFPCYWPFVRGIHRSPVNSPHKGQWRGALMFSLICVWINARANNREAGDLRRYRARDDIIVMKRRSTSTIELSPSRLKDEQWSEHAVDSTVKLGIYTFFWHLHEINHPLYHEWKDVVVVSYLDYVNLTIIT